MKRTLAAAAAAAVVAVAIAPSRARAEPDLGDGPSDREWPRWEIGVRSPVELAAIRDGDKNAWTIATGAAHVGLVLGRLVVLVEGEVDAVMSGDSSMGNLQRVGVGARFHWWRAIGRWKGTRRGRLESRGTVDGFIEVGAGRQWIELPGAPTVARRDLSIGIGIEPGMWLSKRSEIGRSGRPMHVAAFYRIRMLVAPAADAGTIARCSAPAACAAPSGYDLGLGFDMGFTFGR